MGISSKGTAKSVTGTDNNIMTGSLSSATLGASTRRTSDALYGALGAGSVKNVRRKISSTDYTIKYYPDPDDSSKRQKVVVEEETQDTELTTEELKMAFRIFDKVGQGFIGVDRFREILREIDEKVSDDELDGIIAYIDEDKSGTIDFDEFVKIMT